MHSLNDSNIFFRDDKLVEEKAINCTAVNVSVNNTVNTTVNSVAPVENINNKNV